MKWELETGLVAAVLHESPQGRELLVELNGSLERAWQEPVFGVPAKVGDRVLLNTTAVRLGLGTGGSHFVVAVEGAAQTPPSPEQPGHIMKVRYTPFQVAVHAVEEPDHPMHEIMRDAESLDGTPVVICELHSMLPAVAMTLRYEAERRAWPVAKVAYVMTDGAALPLHFSNTVAQLKHLGLLAGTVTVGHAYGGDLEAVTLYSGLLAARHVLEADCIIVAMGPGIVGTGTRYGHTGIEVGTAVNAVHALGGDPVVVPRLSFADSRPRHQGVSHHTLTALAHVALAPATVPLPLLPDEQAARVWSQVTGAGLHQKHRLVGVGGQSILDATQAFPVPLRTMGRDLSADPAFFLAAGSAGEWVARQWSAPKKKKPPESYSRRDEAWQLTDKN